MRGAAGPATAKETRAILVVWLFTLFGSVILVLLMLAAPILRPRSPRLSALLYAVFAPLCHQDPGRCFNLAGYPMAVCGRCFGIDVGFALGAFFSPIIRGFGRPLLPAVRTLLLASFPLALDGTGNLLGLWASPIGIRFAAGVLCGTVLPGYFIAGLYELAMRVPGFRAGGPRSPLDLNSRS